LIIDWYRAKTRWTLTGIDDFLNMVDPRDCPEKAYERQEQSELLERAMRYLTEGQRAVMKLRFLDGYSFLEIAETMENTERAVKALQHRGLVAMRSVIVPLEGA
jgi:RNA polymerase sigma-70 factor (ECF subfamily)